MFEVNIGTRTKFVIKIWIVIKILYIFFK